MSFTLLVADEELVSDDSSTMTCGEGVVGREMALSVFGETFDGTGEEVECDEEEGASRAGLAMLSTRSFTTSFPPTTCMVVVSAGTVGAAVALDEACLDGSLEEDVDELNTPTRFTAGTFANLSEVEDDDDEDEEGEDC